MEFCPDCGCRLEPKKSGGAVVLACTKCSYVKQAEGNRSQAKVVRIIQPNSQPFGNRNRNLVLDRKNVL